MNNEIYKLLALCVHDVLLNPSGQISLEDRNAIISAQEEYGLRIALLSEATTSELLPLAEQLHLTRNSGYIISHHGARIHNCHTGREITSRPIPHEVLQDLTHLLDNHDTLALLGEKTIYASKAQQPRIQLLAEQRKLPINTLSSLTNLSSLVHEPIFGLLILAPRERLVALSEQIESSSLDMLSCEMNSPEVGLAELSITLRGVALDSALDFLLDRLDLSHKNIITVGVKLKDASLIQRAGLGVAMANAPEALKSCADYVTTSYQDSGIAHLIQKHIKHDYEGVSVCSEDANAIMPNTLMGALGIRCTDIAHGYVAGTMPVDIRTRQPMGILHGGASLAFAETLAGLGSVAILNEDEIQVGMQVSGYHIASTTEGDIVRGEAKILHQGRSTHVWNVDITSTQSGKLICTCRVVNSIRRRR